MLARLRHLLPILGISAATLLSGCGKNTESNPSIAGIAVANDDFSVLEDAAVRGGVVGILSNRNPSDPQGNFTVFAPNNAAFARLGLRSAPDLLALNKDFLTSTLFYHVTGGTLTGSSLQPGVTSPSALQGLTRRVITKSGATYINGSRVLATDVLASNGRVHVVDKVLLATGVNIVQSAVAVSSGQVFVQPDLTFLVQAVLYADPSVATTLSSPGPFTVFAPNDQAFRDLLAAQNVAPGSPSGYVPADVRKLSRALVTNVLLQHALPGAKFTPELPENAATPSAGGGAVTFGPFVDGTLTVKAASNPTPAGMVIPDIQCTNGVVHIIDKVLIP